MTPHINRYNIVRQQVLVCHRSMVFCLDFGSTISFFFFTLDKTSENGRVESLHINVLLK